MNSLAKIGGLVLAFASPFVWAAAPSSGSSLDCKAGPVQQEFAASTWNIYACSDGKSAVVVPVRVINGQFGYFFISPKGQGVGVVGEGWGNDASFRPVYERLQRITTAELKAIILAANHGK
jgi:hypothetical protein